MKLSSYLVCHICIITTFVVELHGFQSMAKDLQEFSRTRLMQVSQQSFSQRQTMCGGDVCNTDEKCCQSNGIFGTCCPHVGGICCGASTCCRSGRCCAGGCCEHTNGVCCHNYCCPAGQRCSGNNDRGCVPFGRGGNSGKGAMLSGTSYILLVGMKILMILRSTEII